MTPRNRPLSAGVFLLLSSLLLAGGCERDVPAHVPDEPEPDPPVPGPAGASPVVGSEHLRVLAFVSEEADSMTIVPWIFRSVITEEGIRRERELSFGHAGRWEALLADTIMTPLTRFPWRILPGGPVRIMMGDDDAIDAVVFDESPRTVELVPGVFLDEWISAPGSAWRLHRGRLLLPAGEVDGILLDLNRSRNTGGSPWLDWAFLHDGEGVQLLLQQLPDRNGELAEGEEHWIGWSRIAFQRRSWEPLHARWNAVRPVERARRDVPAAWSFSIASHEGLPEESPFEGELRVVRSFLRAEDGPGPILPVSGFFEVEGEFRVVGETVRIRGLVRHARR